MKTFNAMIRILMAGMFLIITIDAVAQKYHMQNFRPYSKEGLNMFETQKDTGAFEGFKVRIGGGFTQQFQALSHGNVINTDTLNGGYALIDANGDKKDDRQLILITNGFNLAMANLNLDVAVYDGIHLNLVTYLSSRHHQEAWVKGGFIQFDKLTFLKSPAIDKIMESFTIKIGDYEVNYGDQHYRRSDGGHSMYNPFAENLIMDEFTTEIGGEIQYKSKSGIIGVFAVTGGEIKGDVSWNQQLDAVDSLYEDPDQDLYSDQVPLNKRAPSFIGKLGYDKQMNEDLRIRITGSFYTTKSSASNTIFGGDRTGSHYFSVLENSASNITTNAFSGRYNPGYRDQVTTFMINPFVKFGGLELFGTLEFANGRQVSEVDKRNTTQYAVDLIYRFLENENFWIGGRYNTVTSEPRLFSPTGSVFTSEVNINRFAIAAGWYIIDQLMAKIEYVNQTYSDFPSFDIRNEGTFNGVMIEAAIGF